MKRSIPLLVALGCLSVAHAQTTSGEFKLGASSQELFRGAITNDGLTLVPMLRLDLGTGTSVWARAALVQDGGGQDEWRFGIKHTLDLVAASLTIGATRYERPGIFPHTSEVFASAKMKWLVPFTFKVVRDVDVVEGGYYRVSTGSGTPNVSLLNMSAQVDWDIWLGYADGSYAGVYYGDGDGGFADLGGKLSAEFSISDATVTAWVMMTTLVDPDYTTVTGDRTNIAVGASIGWRF